MTTYSHVGPISSNTVPGYIQWITEYDNLMVNSGFARSADSGQLNISAISTLPAANNYSGYKIYYLNDSLHSVRPIYLKIEFGMAGTDRSLIRITFGFATNGTGDIVGTSLSWAVASGSVTTGTGNLTSLASTGEGYGWAVFKYGNFSTVFNNFSITRSATATGIPTAEAIGINLLHNYSTNTAHYFNVSFDNPTPSFTPSTQASFFGGSTGALLSNGDTQYCRTYIACPQVKTNPFIIIGHSTNNQFGATFSISPINGMPPKTYISVDAALGQSYSSITSGAYNGYISAWPGGSQTVSGVNNARNVPLLVWE